MGPDNEAISDHESEASFRGHLLAQAHRHRGFVVIETGGGFYGENFLHQLLDSFEGDSATELLDPDDVDEGLIPEVAVLRAPLVSGLRGWRDVVSARAASGKVTIVVLPPGVDGDIMRREPTPALVLGGAELTYRGADVALLVAEALAARADDERTSPELAGGITEIITQFSEGWPASVHACVNHLRSCDHPAAAAAVFGQQLFRSKVVVPYLEPFRPEDVVRMAQIAHFGSVTPTVAAAIGGLDFAETKLPHAPGVLRATSGMVRFIGPVRHHLTEHHEIGAAAAELIAPILAAEGQVSSAAMTLVQAGLHEMAADLIESVDDPVIDRCNQREMLSIIKGLLDRADGARPALSLKLARVHWNLSEISESIRLCDAALELTVEDSEAWLEVAIERLWYRHLSMDVKEAAKQIFRYRELLDRLGGDAELAAKTRIREVEAYVLAQSTDPLVVDRSVALFEEVARAWQQRGDNLRAARTLRNLASVSLHHLGRYRQAQVILEDAGTLCVDQAFDYGFTMLLKSRFDALCADREAFTVSFQRARHVVDGATSGVYAGHAMLASALDAVWDRNIAEIDRCFRGAKAAFGADLPAPLRILLHSAAAEALAVAGDTVGAKRALDDVRSVVSDHSIDFVHAELVVFARSGDYSAAAAKLRQLAVDPGNLPNDRLWRGQLEVEGARPGGPHPETVDAAMREAGRLGLRSLFEYLGPDLDQADALGPSHRCRLEVLGHFALSRGHSPVGIKRWRKAAQLLAYLAWTGRGVSVEEAADELWPGSQNGVQRIKNVLSSIRRDLGEDVVLRHDKTIRLGTSVVTDVAEFRLLHSHFAVHAETDSVAAVSYAVRALELCDGPIVTSDATDRVAAMQTVVAREVEGLLNYLTESGHPHHAWLTMTMARLSPTSPP